MRMRRKNRRIAYVGLGIFVAVFLFSFLMQRFKSGEEADAVSVAGFDPGYIISDYQMSNYNSMNEGQIQNFLKSMNSCNDTNIGKYTVGEKVNYFSEVSPPMTWHVKDGHFVCMADEVFDGGTAAHIIYRAAQDYQINPQVLLVLLEKEQSLVRDTFPHSQQYRSATGYGCPDTAACSSKYYGLNNQIRNAAALFRTVLNGGWTNYPLGNNYIQYNPSASCGGSVVNVRNLATSALYRYTPYQPNAATLGGWNDGCNAYGNMNFYKLFEGWFGGIKDDRGLVGRYGGMVSPRILFVKRGSRYVVPETGEMRTRDFDSFEYFTHLNYHGSQLCLSIGNNKNCYYYSDLEEVDVSNSEKMAAPRVLIVKNATKIDYEKGILVHDLKIGDRLLFNSKVMVNGELCLKNNNNDNKCVPYNNLEELPEISFQDMVAPRYFSVKKRAEMIDVSTGVSSVVSNDKKRFFDKYTYWFGELCLNNSQTMGKNCILYSALREPSNDGVEDMVEPRLLKVSKGVTINDVENNSVIEKNGSDRILFFNKKSWNGGRLCLIAYAGACINYDELVEVGNFIDMSLPRYLDVNSSTFYYSWGVELLREAIVKGNRLYFVDKIYVDGELCLRTQDDARNKRNRCVMYSDLKE